jgi:hypothetical protein
MKKSLSVSLGIAAVVTLASNAMALNANNQKVFLSWDGIDSNVGTLEFNNAVRYVDLSDKMGSEFEACEHAVKWINNSNPDFKQSTSIFLAEKLTVGNFDCSTDIALKPRTTTVILSPLRKSRGFDIANQVQEVLALWSGESGKDGTLYGAITEKLAGGSQVNFDFRTENVPVKK